MEQGPAMTSMRVSRFSRMAAMASRASATVSDTRSLAPRCSRSRFGGASGVKATTFKLLTARIITEFPCWPGFGRVH